MSTENQTLSYSFDNRISVDHWWPFPPFPAVCRRLPRSSLSVVTALPYLLAVAHAVGLDSKNSTQIKIAVESVIKVSTFSLKGRLPSSVSKAGFTYLEKQPLDRVSVPDPLLPLRNAIASIAAVAAQSGGGVQASRDRAMQRYL